MTTKLSSRVFVSLVALGCWLPALLITHTPWKAAAQNCVAPGFNSGAAAWPPNARVTVNINANQFTQAEFNCLKAAFDNWNAMSGSNGNQSGVEFSPVYSTDSVGTLDANGTLTVSGSNVMQVNKQTTPGNGPGAERGQTNGAWRRNSVANIHPSVTNCTAMTQTIAHEIGHTFGLGECNNCTAPGQSVMLGVPCAVPIVNGQCSQPDYNNTTYGRTGPTPCDNGAIQQGNGYSYPPCDPFAAQSCVNSGGSWNSVLCYCTGGSGGGGGCSSCPSTGSEGGFVAWCDIDVPSSCSDGCDNDGDCQIDANDEGCICPSPIAIDTLGDGFDLTSAADGVPFDIANIGRRIQMSWIQGDDAWLALDRDGNGTIDSGAELFGNHTPQPPSDGPNGFLALAEFDKPENGGNRDGVIDSGDPIFGSLRLWKDVNHNGVSEGDELHTLPALSVEAVALKYIEIRRRDRHGNGFRYAAKVYGTDGTRLGRWAYDVFLVLGE